MTTFVGNDNEGAPSPVQVGIKQSKTMVTRNSAQLRVRVILNRSGALGDQATVSAKQPAYPLRYDHHKDGEVGHSPTTTPEE